MSGRVAGKVAFITGAARGQGRAHAVRLAQEGASVIGVDICRPIPFVTYPHASEADLDETVRLVEQVGGKMIASVVDTRDLAALQAAAEAGAAHFGRLNVVVANAGICVPAAWDDVSPEMFQETISINVTGTWNTVMACAPHLIGAGGGSIVLTSSSAGLKGLPFLLPYVASKHAVTGMARAFAHELAQHRIRVNSLHPFGVDTPMGDERANAAFGPALENNPRLGGMLTTSYPVEITESVDQANAVLFLASDEARYVTALAMTVDGGHSQY